MSLDYFYAFVLYFGNAEFLIPITVIGIFTINREKFLYLILIIIFTIVFNHYMKAIWGIPLNPELLKTGWSYPSGHANTNIVFWAILYMLFERKFILLVALVFIPLELSAMVHFRFHNWHEVFGGVYFGMAIILSCYILMNYIKTLKTFGVFMTVTTTTVYALDVLNYLDLSHNYYVWAWNIFGVLASLMLSVFLGNKNFIITNKLLGLICSGCGLMGAWITYNTMLFISNPIIQNLISGFLSATVILIVTPLIINVITKKLQKQTYN